MRVNMDPKNGQRRAYGLLLRGYRGIPQGADRRSWGILEGISS
jgi:hypothetical protein